MVAPAGIGGPGRSGFASGGPWAKDFLVPSNVGRIAHPGRMDRREQPVVRGFDGIDLEDLEVPAWSRTGSWPKPSAAGWGEPAALPVRRSARTIAMLERFYPRNKNCRAGGGWLPTPESANAAVDVSVDVSGFAHPDNRDVNAR
jgi:hypothetical protein